ncbi:MAG: ABC transporter ATP-binding protein, partial [Deltaproteobacteria bacterium]|nr:ABC transporter ATP-binding protein [Deltaproteobacteria bacterium]
GGENVTRLSTQKRGVGFVFQNYALFKQLTVFQNIAFGLQVQGASKADIQTRVEELLLLLGLKDLGKRFPHQLSGGQRQRVALARALAPSPKVLLLDEPFGAIDAKIRKELREWLRKLHDEMHVTSLFVTHDQEEALEICDKIYVMNHGVIEQGGPPEEIYKRPATEFVANFVGLMNIHDAQVVDGKLQFGAYSIPKNGENGMRDGDQIRVFFRPQDIYISGSSNAYAMQGRIVRRSFLGINIKLEIEAENGFNFTAIIPEHIFYNEKLSEGGQISYQIEEFRYVNLRAGRGMKRLIFTDYEI